MVSVNISFRLSAEERQTIETIAELMGISISEVIRDAIRYYIQSLRENPEIWERIKDRVQWEQYRRETRTVIQRKLWYWNAYRLVHRLRGEGVPEETVKEIIKELGTRMEEIDPEQARRFRQLVMRR